MGHDRSGGRRAGKRPDQGKAARGLNDTDPLHDVVGVRAVDAVPTTTEARAARGDRGRGAVRRAGRRPTSSCAASTTSRACAPTPTSWCGGTRPTAEALQTAYNRLRRTAFGRRLVPVWSQLALHRPAEFNKSHIPAFLADEGPRDYICVYPFVRSYEWYLLEDAERRAMLAEHGQMARDFADVRANTVASFALGDYEWMLGVRGRRAAPDRRPDAASARQHGAAARPRGGAVLHRAPAQRRRARVVAAVSGLAGWV